MSATPERKTGPKKFFGDPVLVVTIIALTLLLCLFILYPLAILLVDSVYGAEDAAVLRRSAGFGRDRILREDGRRLSG